MPALYLQTAYKDRERVKGLGARWDPARRQWYVPEGRDLAPFANWLPAEQGAGMALAAEASRTDLSLPTKGVSLSQLLAGVAAAVADAYRSGEWVRAEVVKIDIRRGHVYLELAERSPSGDASAQARAMIWASTANRIVPAFERATGAVLGAGIKLLIRAKPTFSPQYGMSLVVDAIDPDYTLGDLGAKKREIRLRLQREGVAELNRQLPAPWDYNAVLVVAPEAAAGLGDFQAEARRLERWALCRFVVVHSRFQGEGAAADVRQALLAGLADWPAGLGQPAPDAIVVIRGGGAVNDLAWLNDYELARCICELPIPVLTGIGHERDRSVLDEVAHTSFDTPSKVIAGIEQTIVKRARDGRDAYESIVQEAARSALRTRRALDSSYAEIRSGAQRALWSGREQASRQFQAIRHDSLLHLEKARHVVPAAMAQVSSLARETLREGKSSAERCRGAIVERASQQASLMRERADHLLQQVAEGAHRQVTDARTRAEAIMREIAGQGPEKTLGRGFAVIRDERGATLTSADAARDAADLRIEFRDGRLSARVRSDKRGQQT